MKIIEAMKQIKRNKEVMTDLQKRIGTHCANLSYETQPYGENTAAKITEWIQQCSDLAQNNARLLVAISRTNLATMADIKMGDKLVTKSLAEWIWRRREYAQWDKTTWEHLTDRGLREGRLPTTPGAEPIDVKIVRHYDPEQRDKMLAMYRVEAHEIDSALEVVNAVTDLVE